jgi:hypothetical protein
MWSKDQLNTRGLPPLQPPLFQDFHDQVTAQGHMYHGNDVPATFIATFHDYLLSSELNRVRGLELFGQRCVIQGCNHFIDNLLQRHGVDGLQIFEHDYRYYSRLSPGRTWAQVGALKPGVPVLIAAPFPGALDMHWQWPDIVAECEQKLIPIHIDAAWLGSARDIDLDLSSPVIQSVAFSLSKGLGLAWNRIGVRYHRYHDPCDSITIFNQHSMISEVAMRVGITAMQQIPVDYLWNTFGAAYHDLCRELRLRPTKIIHAVMSLDRRTLYGVAETLVKKTGTEVPV